MILFMVIPLMSFCESGQQVYLKREAKILAQNSCYYYNNRQADKLKACSRQADVLFKRIDGYTDDYFLIKYYESLRDAWDGRYSDAMEEAKHFYQKAEHSNNKMGSILFNELMGLLYEIMEQMGESEVYLNKALQMSLKYYPRDYYNNTQYLSTLVEVQLELQPISNALATIKQMEKLQDDVESGLYGPHKGFRLNRNRRLICSYYMAYYNRLGEYGKTAQYMAKAATYKPDDWYVNFNVDVEASKYYKAIRNYPLALQKINSAISVDDTSNVKLLKEKADIICLMGNKNEAIKMYQLCVDMQKDKRRQQFDKEVAELQNLHSNMQLQLNLKQAQMQQEVLYRRMITIVAFLLFLALSGMTAFAVYRGKVGKQLKRDKSDLAETGKKLKKALARADESNKLKDKFIHNVSHEIRTPLNSIVGYSSIIASESENIPKFKVYSDYIENNTAELLNIVNNMVDLSLYQSVDFSTEEKNDVNLSSLCRDSIYFLQLSGKLNDKVKVSYDGTPENYVLHTSGKFMKSILNHLLINAAKYTTEGSIRIAYTVKPDERCVVFSVSDTGIGVSPECYDSIFESFEKAGSFVQGMGLGLTICRELIRKLGGEISVDRDYKEGARFVFTHPIIV